MLKIIKQHPNLTVDDLLRIYKELNGQSLKYRGKLKKWLRSIPSVSVSDTMRISAESDPLASTKNERPAKNSKVRFSDSMQNLEERSKRKRFGLRTFKQILAKSDIFLSMSYFWDYFDSDRYSIWYCEYKYPEELTLTSETLSIIYDMMNCLGAFWRKAIASMCLFEGNDDCSATISGVWVWKSPDMLLNKREWRDVRDSFTWRELDTGDRRVRTFVDDYFLLDGEFDGKELIRGILFQ